MKPYTLTFLKLGGSLITDKSKPNTAKLNFIKRIAVEIADAKLEEPEKRLLIGHGSGSFGHAAASRHQTHLGGQGQAYWQGFAEVWGAARTLNQIVINNLAEAELPVLAFPPSAGIISANQAVQSWDTGPINRSLDHNLIPIVQGDVVFDCELGGTILSTEHIFYTLAQHLHPERVLIAGLEPGVLQDADNPCDIIDHITPSTIEKFLPALSGANTADVTGGMLSKVQLMTALVQKIPTLEVQIFSGLKQGNIYRALQGERFGTIISI